VVDERFAPLERGAGPPSPGASARQAGAARRAPPNASST